MANENRLIDANALCEFFQERYEYLRSASETPLPNGMVRVDAVIQGGAIIAKEFLDKAKNAPTVDAVEVVRCKDCKHWRRYIGVNGDACSYGECDVHDLEAVVETDEDYFCSYGERREGE